MDTRRKFVQRICKKDEVLESSHTSRLIAENWWHKKALREALKSVECFAFDLLGDCTVHVVDGIVTTTKNFHVLVY